MHEPPLVSVVIPVHGEGAHLVRLLEEIRGALDPMAIRYELIVVDDGSRDGTWDVLARQAARLPALRALRLSRNFGKECAISAALDIAAGDAAIVMDGDFQHPPSLLPEMIRRWQAGGCDVVEAVKRVRQREPLLRRLGARAFYRLFGGLSGLDLEGATDFKLLDRKVLAAWRSMGERLTFFRGMIGWLGYRRETVVFDVPSRTTGASRWSLRALAWLAVKSLTAYTALPLRFVTVMGAVFFVFASALGLRTLIQTLRGEALSGFPTVILALLLTGSIIMVALGIIGEYLANIYEEVKRRPRYVVSNAVNVEPAALPDESRTTREAL